MVSDNYLPRTPRHWASIAYGRSIYRVPRAKPSSPACFLSFLLSVSLSLCLSVSLSLALALALAPDCRLLPVSSVSLKIGSNVMIIPGSSSADKIVPWNPDFFRLAIGPVDPDRRRKVPPNYEYRMQIRIRSLAIPARMKRRVVLPSRRYRYGR
jgi:hypothetical protein